MLALPPGSHRLLYAILGGSVLLLLAILLLLPYVVEFPDTRTLTQRLAAAHGVDDLPDDAVIEFRFQMRQREQRVDRRWRWYRATGRIELLADDSEHAPDDPPVAIEDPDDELGDETVVRLRTMFEHDLLWLSPALAAVERDDVHLEDNGLLEAPIGDGDLRKLTLRITDDEHPLAAHDYELFVEEDDTIRQWIIRRREDRKGVLMCRWLDYESAGPLRISTRRVWSDIGLEANLTIDIHASAASLDPRDPPRPDRAPAETPPDEPTP